ncbi:hypothetical protein G9A89_021241 [Geosiphon pyriformis]|nr:hypothetical protein G9A89_021241 [Geosiphon pyriformis]
MVTGKMLLCEKLGIMSKLAVVDKLLVTAVDRLFGAVVNKLLVSVVDKLKVHILVVNRLAAVSLAGKWVDIDLDLGNGSGGDQFVDQALIPGIGSVL